MFASTRRSDWQPLENRTARDWIERGAGREAYELLWRRLFDLKFFEYADTVSAAWIWTRIKRVGTSRRSLMQEQRSEEHTSELQSLMRSSYAVFCLKKKIQLTQKSRTKHVYTC